MVLCKRPKRLSDIQRKEIDSHADVQEKRQYMKSLIPPNRSIASIKGTLQHSLYTKAAQDLHNLKRRHNKELLKAAIKKHNKEQPIDYIERQLKGMPPTKEKPRQPAIYTFTERTQATDALFNFAPLSDEEGCQRRTTAINALVSLSQKQEHLGFRQGGLDPASDEQRTPLYSSRCKLVFRGETIEEHVVSYSFF